MSPHPRAGRPERVGDLLRERIEALGWEGRLREEQALAVWDAAVGPRIAAHARPSHVANRRLTVVTESPVWTQQLSLLKPELLRRIAARAGPDAVTDLFFVTGRIEPAAAPQPEEAPVAAPAADLPPALERELAAIPDPDLRESLRRLMLAARAGDPPEREPPA